MKEHPILFNGDAVRAILAGRKTQTRRPVKPQPVPSVAWDGLWVVKTDGKPSGMTCINATDWDVRYWCDRWCPYNVGDHLWMRETWALISPESVGDEAWYRIRRERPWRLHPDSNELEGAALAIYRADGEFDFALGWDKWRPSIHMPRWASRIMLEVISVRVQRVQDITAEDAIAGGIATWIGEYGFVGDFDEHADCLVTDLQAVFSMSMMWNSIYAKRGLGWDVNPWVWAIEFRRELMAGGKEG